MWPAQQISRKPEKTVLNNDSSAFQLLQAFLLFFGKYFDKRVVISINSTNCIDKRSILAQIRRRKREGEAELNISGVCRFASFFCVEDPFETFNSDRPHDLMQVMSEEGVDKVNNHLQMAVEIIEGDVEGEEEIWRQLLLGNNKNETRHSVRKKEGGKNRKPSSKQHDTAKSTTSKGKSIALASRGIAHKIDNTKKTGLKGSHSGRGKRGAHEN